MKKIGLKFWDGPINTGRYAYHKGIVAATIRYDDEKGISEGDRLELLDEDGDTKWGVADVVVVRDMPLIETISFINQYNAHYEVESVPYLVRYMNRFYDDEIVKDTEVKVIIYNPILLYEVA